MRQRIEDKRETKSPEVAVTVMFSGRSCVLGVYESFRARDNAAPSLSAKLAVYVAVVPGASSLSAFLKLPTKVDPSRHRMRHRSLSHIEKFSAEASMARSALAVLAANPERRGRKAAATVITKTTEQRRCAAA
jgi:hypothetical protein